MVALFLSMATDSVVNAVVFVWFLLFMATVFVVNGYSFCRGFSIFPLKSSAVVLAFVQCLACPRSSLYSAM